MGAVAAFGIARSGKLFIRAVIGMALGFLYFVADNFALAMGNLGAYPPFLAAWAPFLVAFIVATITAMSYLELVTKYPQAAGAALYTHKAFGIHFVTFLVAFIVMCSGITSASSSIAASRAALKASAAHVATSAQRNG